MFLRVSGFELGQSPVEEAPLCVGEGEFERAFVCSAGVIDAVGLAQSSARVACR
jgi:hypothetical protein